MIFPKTVHEIVKRIAQEKGDNIDEATKEAEAEIRKLPDFKKIVDKLVTCAVKELIYDARHMINVRIKKELGGYDAAPKVISGKSGSVNRAARSWYNLRIGSSLLGNIMGHELAGLAKAEQARAKGHSFNAKLCSALDKIVPDMRQVREAVTETKLRQLVARLKEEEHVKEKPKGRKRRAASASKAKSVAP